MTEVESLITIQAAVSSPELLVLLKAKRLEEGDGSWQVGDRKRKEDLIDHANLFTTRLQAAMTRRPKVLSIRMAHRPLPPGAAHKYG